MYIYILEVYDITCNWTNFCFKKTKKTRRQSKKKLEIEKEKKKKITLNAKCRPFTKSSAEESKIKTKSMWKIFKKNKKEENEGKLSICFKDKSFRQFDLVIGLKNSNLWYHIRTSITKQTHIKSSKIKPLKQYTLPKKSKGNLYIKSAYVPRNWGTVI